MLNLNPLAYELPRTMDGHQECMPSMSRAFTSLLDNVTLVAHDNNINNTT